MDLETFIKYAQEYYGNEYNELQERHVRLWLKKRATRLYPLIWSEVIKSNSTKYRCPPDINALENAQMEIMNHRHHEIPPSEAQKMIEDEPDLTPGEYQNKIASIYNILNEKKIWKS